MNPSVRFPNEAASLSDSGDAVILRVTRPGIGAVNAHPSDSALDDWYFDRVILNDGSLEDLEGEVQRVLGEFS